MRRTGAHRNLLTHLTAAIVVPGCIALGWWQITRALGGNSLSWAYVFEWPIFAGYGVFMWWKLIHERAPADGTGGAEAPESAGDGTGLTADQARDGDGTDLGESEEEDEELASYNRYLAALHASGKRKQW